MTLDPMRFTLRQIEYFIATAETGSITLAAERVNVSQPSISTAITQLERELGTQLFLRRHAQGVSLTSQGRTMLVEAKKLIEQAQFLYTVASEATDQIRGQIHLGCMATLAPMIMPELSHGFTRAFPGTSILQTVGDHEQLLKSLATAETDIAITYDLLIPDSVDFLPLASLPVHAVVGEMHPLAGEPAVTLEARRRASRCCCSTCRRAETISSISSSRPGCRRRSAPDRRIRTSCAPWRPMATAIPWPMCCRGRTWRWMGAGWCGCRWRDSIGRW